MDTYETAAPGAETRARPEKSLHDRQSEFTPSARPVQEVATVRVWRIRRRPYRVGVRGHDASLAAFERLDRYRQDTDYVLMLHPDSRALALVEVEYWERLRRAAYGWTPPLDALQLDDAYAAEDDAWTAGARNGG